MTTFWRPSDNPDHQVEMVDPENIDTWIVQQGTKDVKTLVKENLERPKPTINAADRGKLKALQETLRLKYKLASLDLGRI